MAEFTDDEDFQEEEEFIPDDDDFEEEEPYKPDDEDFVEGSDR